jgi:hypothetical protein
LLSSFFRGPSSQIKGYPPLFRIDGYFALCDFIDMLDNRPLCRRILQLVAFASILPLSLRAQTNSPGTALVFNGTSQDVTVPNQASLNAFPITVMCWFRTTSANEGGLVNKYVASSLNGYSIIVQNGHLEGWYYAGSGGSVGGSQVLTGGVVNDGKWHHAALVVDATSGRLYLDGALAASQSWSGTPGPTTTTQPISIGDYPGLAAFYNGEMDEASLWSVALYQSQIQTYMNRSLAGTEPNLVAYWRFDEGAGSTTADVSGNGNTGSLIASPVWTNSDAPVGIVAPTGFSTNWSEAAVVGAHDGKIASSADGIKLVYVNEGYATGAFTSSNGGVSWQSSPLPTGYWDNAACSVDGIILYASQSAGYTTNIYKSTNSGTTWNAVTSLAPNNWCLACSADGSTVVTATQNGIIAVSTNAGATWVSNIFSGLVWHAVTCSSDGTHMVALASLQPVYYSTNSGVSWYQATPNPNYYWDRIAATPDGRILITGDYLFGSPIFQSTNYGVTWQTVSNSPTSDWSDFASSADGSKLIACGSASVDISVDSGQTWKSTLPFGSASTAISADGIRSVVCYSANAYSSLSSPTLAFTPIGGNNFVVSWPNPSTGFNLQQSATLVTHGWTNTPIRPSVIGYQNQVTVTNAGNNLFRLEFP